MQKRKPSRLMLDSLEVRMCPVIGAFDIQGPVLAGEGFDGVARLNAATGALLSTARHVLTAAHVSTVKGTKTTIVASPQFRVESPGGSVAIKTPGLAFDIPSGYPPAKGSPDNYDIGIMTLAELGPLTAERWDIYTGTDEVGKVGTLAGYGGTGTGTIGHSTDVAKNQYWSTSTGQGRNYELIRLQITGNPTGGTFKIRNAVNAGVSVPFNVTASQLATEIDKLTGINQTLVRLVGDTDGDGLIDDISNPYAGQFEILFRGTTDPKHSLPDIVLDNNLTGGTNPSVTYELLLDGGTGRFKTTGKQGVGLASTDGARLYTDFDNGQASHDTLGDGTGQGANEGQGTWGDSGSPLFIDGKIAGVLEGLYGEVEGKSSGGGLDGLGGSGDFGEIDSWARTSFHQEWINGILSKKFDLVLNMNTQPIGGDKTADVITLSRVGNDFQISFNGAVVYTESLSLINKITVKGSTDAETFELVNLNVNVPVVIEGGKDNDIVNVIGSTPKTLNINGQDGDDTINVKSTSFNTDTTILGSGGQDTVNVGTGDLNATIRGGITVLGKGKSIDVYVNDTAGPADNSYQFLYFNLFKPEMDGVIGFDQVRSLTLDTTGDRDFVHVNNTQPNVKFTINTGGGDDAVFVGGGNIAATIDGKLTLHGGFGNDSLTFSNFNSNAASTNYSLGVTTFDMTGLVPDVNYAFFNKVRINGANGKDTFNVNGIEAGVDVEVQGQGGNDTMNLKTVPPAIVKYLGGSGTDKANLFGSSSDDALTLEGSTVKYAGAGEVQLPGIEIITLDSGKGDDLLAFQGILGEYEDVHVQGSTTANTGKLIVTGGPTIQFIATEDISAAGDLADDDTLTFHGTSSGDWFVTDFTAVGTSADPILKFDSLNGGRRLTLRDYSGFARLDYSGLGGADKFDFFIDPNGSLSRNVHVNGGSPTSGSGDKLTVRYEGLAGASDIPAVGAARAGKVNVQYPPRSYYNIGYVDIEKVELINV